MPSGNHTPVVLVIPCSLEAQNGHRRARAKTTNTSVLFLVSSNGRLLLGSSSNDGNTQPRGGLCKQLLKLSTTIDMAEALKHHGATSRVNDAPRRLNLCIRPGGKFAGKAPRHKNILAQEATPASFALLLSPRLQKHRSAIRANDAQEFGAGSDTASVSREVVKDCHRKGDVCTAGAEGSLHRVGDEHLKAALSTNVDERGAAVTADSDSSLRHAKVLAIATADVCSGREGGWTCDQDASTMAFPPRHETRIRLRT